MVLQIQDMAPDLSLPDDTGNDISLLNYRGKSVVLYFYPKDDTPGCTKQACTFTENLSRFNDLNVDVLGISKDSVQKHQKFKAKHNLNFPILSDEHDQICEKYGVWKEKNMYGKKYMGIERTTFLINPEGKISYIWNKAKVNNHIEDILNTLSQKG
jgi:peroxiredoxin Q/BCP